MKIAIRERPIIFSAEMVRAILDGRKTQTRRVVKPQPYREPISPTVNSEGYIVQHWPDGDIQGGKPCPCGITGDRLWVRETFTVGYECDEHGSISVLAPTGEDQQRIFRRVKYRATDAMPEDSAFRWKSSLHMPRWASRILLEITGVRVGRLWNISRADVLAEGIEARHLEKYDEWFHKNDVPGHAFGEVWNPINAKRGHGWETNPWVWVIEFKRIEP